MVFFIQIREIFEEYTGFHIIFVNFYLPLKRKRHIISRPARRREIIICTMCVRECVTQFSLKLLQLHFLRSSIFFRFGELWPTFE